MLQTFSKVRLAGVGVELPQRQVTSAEIERKLKPLYNRLGLPEGRLEGMSGIHTRRWCDVGVKPSDLSIEAGIKAIASSVLEKSNIGCLIHSSVCRDFLEPATASVVHHGLGLTSECQIFDVSNACLGMLSSMSIVANMIEQNQIEAGLIVSGEDGRALVETTVEQLNNDQNLTRKKH